MKEFFLIVIIITQFIAVFAQKDSDLDCDVRPVSSKFEIDGKQVYYALPKNKIRIAVRVKKTMQYKGPYSEYAYKYLHISEGVIQATSEYYSIVGVEFQRISLPDSNQFYRVDCNGENGFTALQLNSDGVLVGCNSSEPILGYETNTDLLSIPEQDDPEFYFTDLGVKPFITDKVETLYRSIPTDSTPSRVSYTQSKKLATSEESNAEEAADFIRKLRKRRMKVLFGYKDETFPIEGRTMEIVTESIDAYEQKYLELFMGKTMEHTQTYYFEFDPDEESDAEQQIVAWFSPKKGIKSNKPEVRRSDYDPLIAIAYTLGKIPETQIQVMDKSQKSPIAIKYGLYYRIPGRLNITLQFNNRVLAQQHWEIAQKGKVVPLPVAYINDSKYAIEFFPETGGLRRIYVKSNE